jgi:hypothetical protein
MGQPSNQAAQPVPCTTIKPQRPLRFMCVGPTQGVIAPIVDAGHLNTRKPARPARQRQR